jgi:hypothetical protein
LYWNRSPEPVADVPPSVDTVMSTVPAACAGDVAEMLVELFTVYEVAATAPKYTPVTNE